ncbi:MAG: L-threonylcarbamoyladenylate synthase [Candidatus Omnitrophota bacterium]|jgi:L-threonylcarbamoyladenylate synthase
MILKPTEANLKKCASLLRSGQVGAMPTETVYGLAANALDVNAVGRIFHAKKRPITDPLIVHIVSIKDVNMIASEVPDPIKKLMKRFWPGPLTVVLPKRKEVPNLVTAGLDTVAIRMPSHPIARQLIKTTGFPLAAPSANHFGRTSITGAAAVEEEFGDDISFVLDGGDCAIGLESTILKYDDGKIIILRPGGIDMEAIQKALPKISVQLSRGVKIEAPGQMDQHYATQTPLLYSQSSYASQVKYLEGFRDWCQQSKKPFPRLGFLTFDQKPTSTIFVAGEVLTQKKNYKKAASRLFHSMRELDKCQLDFIIAEDMPRESMGLAMHDRLKRASMDTDIREQFKYKVNQKRKAIKNGRIKHD